MKIFDLNFKKEKKNNENYSRSIDINNQPDVTKKEKKRKKIETY